jgi:chromosomal replication initiation ATPase DnaA
MEKFKTIAEMQKEQFNIVFDVVCEKYKVTPEQIKSKSRKIEFIRPKQMIYLLAYTMIDKIPQKDIIKWCGGGDRSVVAKTTTSMVGWIETDSKFAEEVATVKKLVYENITGN